MAKRSAAVARARALASVVEERERQIYGENFNADHDDKHDGGELAKAAAAYALEAAQKLETVELAGMPPRPRDHPHFWPWASKWWKPGEPRRDLVRAAALLLAEIERIDRRGE